jgi:hypothetical protein
MKEFEDDIFEEFFRKQDIESKEIINNIITFIEKQIQIKSIDKLNRQLISELIVEYLNLKDIGIRPTDLRKIFDHYRQKIMN